MQEYIKNIRIRKYNPNNIKWWNSWYRIVKPLEDSGLLIKGVTETFQNEVKEQKGGFLSALLGTLGAGLLGYLLICKGAIATSQGWGIYRAGKGKSKGIEVVKEF